MFIHPLPRHSSETGSVLVLAVMISLLMLIMATTLIGFAYFTSQQSYFYHDYAQALYAAEAGLNRIVATPSNATYLWLTDTVGSNNCNYYAAASTYANGTIYATSTGVVSRIRSVHRIVQVQMTPADSPWNHMLWGGGDEQPAGNDPSQYPSGYNSTTNGPKYTQRYIPRYLLDSANHWTPYYGFSTDSPGNLFISRTTTIPTTGSNTTQLTISWSGNVCNIYGTYNGLIYIQGGILIDKNRTLTVNGTLISIGGNIDVDNNAWLIINQNITHMDYVSLACIDTTASDDFTTYVENPNAGNINQLTGNAYLTVNGGTVYCSAIYNKNGTGTNINGVVVGMGFDIDGWPSGTFIFDPDVYLNPPLGFDISKIVTLRQIASKSWRELPYEF
jgi:hypothetical protein